jgi:hypothetical protein
MEFSRAWRFNESSLRTQGPQRERDCAHRDAAASRLSTVANALRTNKRRWLWVPAFAGTTR